MGISIANENDTRTKLLNAAKELFAEKGFDGASIRDIADRANVNKSLVHYHFKNKLNILNELAELYLERAKEFTSEFFSNIVSADFASVDFEGFFNTLLQSLIEDKDFLNILIIEGLKFNTDRYFIYDLIDSLIEGMRNNIKNQGIEPTDYNSFLLNGFFLTVIPILIYVLMGEKIAERQGCSIDEYNKRFAKLMSDKILKVYLEPQID